MNEPSLQERLAPEGRCFGCGPRNAAGLRIRSYAEGDEVVAEWSASGGHEAFPGFVNGGILGTLLDCHSNWTAIHHLMSRDALAAAPSTVTASLALRFLRPTPSDAPLRLRAHVVESSADRATVEASVEAGGATTVTSRATFVVVGPGHPAFGRW